MKEISKIGVLLRPSTPELGEIYLLFKDIANAHNIDVNLDNSSALMIGTNGVEFDFLLNWCDILVTLGGDGTLISAIRRSISYCKPIFGINTGRLGFLTAIGKNEIKSFIPKLCSGDYVIHSHIVLEGTINNKKLHCVNEFLIAKQNISGMIKIIAKVNNKHFNTYFSDGLIIGTPAGSTAHNVSAGGAIIYPYNRNILLTPICAHSLTQRPLVLNDEFVLDFELKDSIGNIVIDGQDVIPFNENDRLSVVVSRLSANLIYDRDRDYFSVLREKFNWGV